MVAYRILHKQGVSYWVPLAYNSVSGRPARISNICRHKEVLDSRQEIGKAAMIGCVARCFHDDLPKDVARCFLVPSRKHPKPLIHPKKIISANNLRFSRCESTYTPERLRQPT